MWDNEEYAARQNDEKTEKENKGNPIREKKIEEHTHILLTTCSVLRIYPVILKFR